MPENLELRFFSICLGRAPGSAGHVTWHDQDPSKLRSFRPLTLANRMSWTAELRDVPRT